MVFHLSLRDSKSSQVTQTHLSILEEFNTAVVWVVSTCPLISKSSSLFIYPSVIVPRAPITLDIKVNFMFHIIIIIIIIIILHLWEFFLHQRQQIVNSELMVYYYYYYYYFIFEFFLSALGESLSLGAERQQVPSVSSTLFSILADLNNASVWMVSIRLPIFNFSSPHFLKLLGIVTSVPITIRIIITHMFHNFHSSQARSKFLYLFALPLIFTLWSAGMPKSVIIKLFILKSLLRYISTPWLCDLYEVRVFIWIRYIYNNILSFFFFIEAKIIAV